MKSYRILVINPGSTSTKVAVFEDKKEILMSSISHTEAELQQFSSISDQHSFRLAFIEEALIKNGFDIKTIDCVVGRGGLLHPIPSGTYRVNEVMFRDLEKGEWGEHAANLGGIIAYHIGRELSVPAYVVDPVVVDELNPVARITGMPELERRSLFHALNQKAMARRAAEELGKKYEEANLIVVHMGGGISVGVHEKGRVVDVNNALNGDGPFAPERAGSLPAGQLVELCFSGQYTKEELEKRLVGNAGMVAHLGTNDMRKFKTVMNGGESRARLIYEAMAYQVAKEIGSCASVLKGKIDGIILTGGLSYDEAFVNMIRDRTQWIARFFIFPGEKEMEAMALGGLRVCRGEEEAKVYEFMRIERRHLEVV